MKLFFRDNLCPYCRSPIAVRIPLFVAFYEDDGEEDGEASVEALGEASAEDNDNNGNQNHERAQERASERNFESTPDDPIDYIYMIPFPNHSNLRDVRVKRGKKLRHLDVQYISVKFRCGRSRHRLRHRRSHRRHSIWPRTWPRVWRRI